jgi:hypothetical protein
VVCWSINVTILHEVRNDCLPVEVFMSHLNLSKGCFLLAIPTVGRGIHGALGICQKVLRLWQSSSQACTHWYQMQRSGMFNHFSQLLWQQKPGSDETKFQLSFSRPLDISLLTFWIYAILSKAQNLNTHPDKPKLHRNPMKGWEVPYRARMPWQPLQHQYVQICFGFHWRLGTIVSLQDALA